MFLGFGLKNPPFFTEDCWQREMHVATFFLTNALHRCMAVLLQLWGTKRSGSWILLQLCGLFGMYHDWCESFSTYPRTYDLLHADHLFSKLTKRFVSLVLDIILSFWYIILVKLRNWNQLMWLVQQENNNNDFHALSLTCFFDMYK